MNGDKYDETTIKLMVIFFSTGLCGYGITSPAGYDFGPWASFGISLMSKPGAPHDLTKKTSVQSQEQLD